MRARDCVTPDPVTVGPDSPVAEIARALDVPAGHGLFVITIGTGGIAAGLSSIMNNMPTVPVVALSIDASTTQSRAKQAMVYANVIGSDPLRSAPTCHQTRLLNALATKVRFEYNPSINRDD